MRNRALILCGVLSLLSAGMIGTGRGYQEPEEPWLELSFSRVKGNPTAEVSLPIYVTSNANVQAPMTISLRFPTAKLEYKELETGYLARRSGWRLTARVGKVEGDPEEELLEIDVEPGTGELFPNGVIAYARFAIQKKVAKGDIELKASLTVAGTTSAVLRMQPATITVYTNPIYGCFFYMH